MMLSYLFSILIVQAQWCLSFFLLNHENVHLLIYKKCFYNNVFTSTDCNCCIADCLLGTEIELWLFHHNILLNFLTDNSKKRA